MLRSLVKFLFSGLPFFLVAFFVVLATHAGLSARDKDNPALPALESLILALLVILALYAMKISYVESRNPDHYHGRYDPDNYGLLF